MKLAKKTGATATSNDSSGRMVRALVHETEGSRSESGSSRQLSLFSFFLFCKITVHDGSLRTKFPVPVPQPI